MIGDDNSKLRSIRIDQSLERQEINPSLAPDSRVDEVQKLIRSRRVVLVGPDNTPLTNNQIAAMLGALLSGNTLQAGGDSASDPESLVDSWKSKINAYADQYPGKPLVLNQLLLNFLPSPFKGVFALGDEPPREKSFDQNVVDVYLGVMEKNDRKRSEIRDLLASLAAESKIFSLIQSGINTAMAQPTWFDISGNWTKFNLNDRTRYGYTTDEQWKQSAEYKLLSNLTTFPKDANGYMSIKDFLSGVTKSGSSGPPKESGAMDGLKDWYAFEKENNPLASFGAAIGDRARMVNDKVSQQTIILKDVTNRYDSAIESLNRFLQKMVDVMEKTLSAV